MGPRTQVIIERRPLEGLHQAIFVPNPSTLPPEYLALHSQQIEQVLLDGYLRPHFLGWYRPIVTNEVVRIGNIDFQVAPSSQPFGFVGTQTRVIVDVRHILRQNRVIALSPGLSHMHHHQIIMRQNSAAQRQPHFTPIDGRRALPVKIADQQYIDGDHNTCVVCITDYELGDRIKTLPCCKDHTAHDFHEECIDTWLQRSEECPLCKANVVQLMSRR